MLAITEAIGPQNDKPACLTGWTRHLCRQETAG